MKNESFYSQSKNNKTASDSAFNSSCHNIRKEINNNSKNNVGGTQCRSTCSIVLSADADFLPVCRDNITEKKDSFTCNISTDKVRL